MCLAADVPLIESGTTGYHGQVQIIKRVCYTKPYPPSRTFGVLTSWRFARVIRNVTTATPNLSQRAFRFVQSAARLASRSTASSGPRITYSRSCLEPRRKPRPSWTSAKTRKMVNTSALVLDFRVLTSHCVYSPGDRQPEGRGRGAQEYPGENEFARLCRVHLREGV